MATSEVVRIPIAGPSPFNTLVVVQQGLTSIYKPALADGRLHRSTLTAGTTFVLRGHDRWVKPRHEHSTVVTLHHLSQAEDAAFTYAADAVRGYFNQEDGRWMLDIAVASLGDRAAGVHALSFSSWIMCTEEPQKR